MSVQKYLKYLNEFFELESSPEKSLVKKKRKDKYIVDLSLTLKNN
jgi:hypothetical protein